MKFYTVSLCDGEGIANTYFFEREEQANAFANAERHRFDKNITVEGINLPTDFESEASLKNHFDLDEYPADEDIVAAIKKIENEE